MTLRGTLLGVYAYIVDRWFLEHIKGHIGDVRWTISCHTEFNHIDFHAIAAPNLQFEQHNVD